MFGDTLDCFDCYSLSWIFESKNIVTSDINYFEVCIRHEAVEVAKQQGLIR